MGGWRDRVWPGCFAGVLCPEESVDVLLVTVVGGGVWSGQLWRGAGPCCGGGGGAGGWCHGGRCQEGLILYGVHVFMAYPECPLL